MGKGHSGHLFSLPVRLFRIVFPQPNKKKRGLLSCIKHAQKRRKNPRHRCFTMLPCVFRRGEMEVHVFYESVIFFFSVYKDSNKELLYQIILLDRQSMSHHAMHKYLKQTLQTLQILEILKISVICMRIQSNRATDYYAKSI